MIQVLASVRISGWRLGSLDLERSALVRGCGVVASRDGPTCTSLAGACLSRALRRA